MDLDHDMPSPKRRKTSSRDFSVSPPAHSPAHSSPRRDHSHRPSDRELTLQHARASGENDPSRMRYERSGTPDELVEDQARTFWRDETPPRRQRGRRSTRRSSSRPSSRSDSSDRSPRSTSAHSSDRASRPPSPPLPPAPKTLAFTPLFTLPKAHARGITCVKFSPSTLLLATASADATINVYSTMTEPFTLLKTLTGHLAGINVLAWSPDSEVLASGSDDKSIRLWSIDTGTPYPTPLMSHHNYVYSLAFSPKGNMLVSGSFDEAVFLWDVRSARVMRSLPAHSDPVGGVDFLRDSTMVCSCAGDGLIRIWDAGTGQCLKTLVDEDRRPVTSVRFSPNGKFLFAWTLDSSIRLWDYREGTCMKTYQGHLNSAYSLAGAVGSYMGGREAFVASGSEDGDVLVWDVGGKEVLWRGRAHRKVVLGVDFCRRAASTTGDVGKGMLVSGGLDREIRVWIESDHVGNHGDQERDGRTAAAANTMLNGSGTEQNVLLDRRISSQTSRHGVDQELGADEEDEDDEHEHVDVDVDDGDE